MSKHNHVFELINAMSKTEKRYFKVFAATHVKGTKNKYETLFDAIKQQSSYNELKVKDSLKDEKLKKNFAVEKNHLYNILLRDLSNFHREGSMSAKASNALHTIRILIQKALYEQAEKLIAKTRKFAEQSEHFSLLLQVHHLHLYLLDAVLDNDAINQTYKEVFRVQEIQANLTQLKFLHHKVYEIISEVGRARSETSLNAMNELMRHELLQDEELARSYEAKIRWNEIHMLRSYLVSDTTSGYKYSKRSIELSEAAPFYTSEKRDNYISNLNNFCIFAMERKEFDVVDTVVSKLKKMVGKDSTNLNEVNIFYTTTLTEANLLIMAGRFEDADRFVNELESTFHLFQDSIMTAKRMSIYNNVSYLYFGANRFRDALRWNNKIMQSEKTEHRTDIQSFAHIFNLIVHFELEHYDHLDYILSSTEEQLSKKESLFDLEQLLLKLIKELIHTATKRQKVEVFRRYKSKFELLFKNPAHTPLLQSFEFLIWIDSKTKGVPFAQLYRRLHLGQ